MSKLWYVIRILCTSFGKKLCLIWLMILAIAFGLTMSLGIAKSQTHIQSYYLNDDMRELAYFVDSASSYYSDSDDYARSAGNVVRQLENWPGMRAVYEQVTATAIFQGFRCYGYSEGLIERLHLPSSQPNVDVSYSGRGNEIWLDNRLIGQYGVGDELELALLSGGARLPPSAFKVAGFLGDENAHYDFQVGSSYEAYSSNFIVVNPDSLVCVLISDTLFEGAEFDGMRSCAKFLLPETSDDIAVWKQLARGHGLGHVSDMSDILANDRANTDLMTTPILILCVIMLILTCVGLIGTQIQLMQLYKQAAFSLALCGMTWKTWKAAWLTVFCSTLMLASFIGGSLGNAWKTVVMIEPLGFVSPISLLVSVAIVMISAIGILPTISRWSRIDVNEFRRLCE